MRTALRTPRVALVPVVLALGTLVASRAHAQSADVVRGREQFEAAAIADAETTFRGVVASPTATRADLAAAHRYLAALALARGREDDARRIAAIALALEPAASVPPGAPPGLLELFERARRPAGDAGLAVSVALPRTLRAGELPEPARLATHAVPEGLGARVRVRCAADGRELGALEADAPAGDATMAVPLGAPGPTSTTLACDVALVTAAGATLARASGRAPIVATVAAASRAVAVTPAPRRRRNAGGGAAVGWVVGITVAALLVGGAVALGVVLADTDAHLGAPQLTMR